jgi:tetratricopeptide (TPR) repeat protein
MRNPLPPLLATALVLLAAAGCRDTALDHYNLGIEAMERGDTTAAVTYFESSVAERPADMDAQVNLGVALLGAGQPEQALEHLQIAAQANPADVVVHLNMAEAYKTLGRYQAAKTEYEYALKQDPEMVEALAGYGELLLEAEQYQAASEALLKAITLRPTYAPSQFHMAWLYMRTGRYLDATHYFIRGLRSDPNSRYGRLGLAESYLSRNMPDDALVEFQKVYAADSTVVAAMIGIGDCQVRGGNWVQAESILRRALEAAPEDPRIHKCLGDAFAGQGRNVEAVGHYRMATQLDNEYAGAWLGLGTALEAAGDLDQAQSALENALLHAPLDPEVLYRLGLVHAQQGDPNLARSYYEMALDVVGSDRALSTRIRTALDDLTRH